MKHTPGPWKYEAEVAYGRDIITEDGKIWLGTALNMHNNPGSFPTSGACKKNAQLMSASPDLLEACKMALESYRIAAEHHNIEFDAVPIEDAIKKARGE